VVLRRNVGLQAMPYVLRGILDDILVEVNANRLRNPVEDPMPKMIEVWQQFNVWCNQLTRFEFSMSHLLWVEEVTLELMSNIKEVFPDKHGPRDKVGAWNVSKFHDAAKHFGLSVKLFGSLQVLSVTLRAPFLFSECPRNASTNEKKKLDLL
jgi:hypothetical protein